MQDITVALRNASGLYLHRCSGCIPGVKDNLKQNTVFCRIKEEEVLSKGSAHWKLQKLDNGNYALKSNNGNYLSRVSGGIPDVKPELNPNGIFTAVEAANPDELPKFAQFTIERLDFNGTYALKNASNDKYLGRLSGGIPSVRTDAELNPNNVFARLEEIKATAQWTIIILP